MRSADCLRIFPLPCAPHPSSFGHFLPLSGRYAAISNELRVRKIYKTSEQLASHGETACYLPLVARDVCGAWHGNQQPRSPPSCSLPRNSSSCFIFLFPPRFPLFEVPPPVSKGGRGLPRSGARFAHAGREEEEKKEDQGREREGGGEGGCCC